jgi:hypothetical protein
MHYKQLTSKIYSYNDLNPHAKTKARNEVINIDLQSLNKAIVEFKQKIKHNINSCVNDKNIIPYFIRKKIHCNKLSDLEYCEAYILSNLCNFTIDGTYITYSIK